MDLAQEDFAALSALLDGALDVPQEQRLDWLAAQKDIPARIRELASDLLNPRGTPFSLPGLPHYRESDLGPLDGAQAQLLAPGMLIGPYRLLREIGQGGMGTVWLAERSDAAFKREVALKLPHASLSNRHLAERFSRERDILAALVHPNIARLYDAGITSDGRPYLALEYVDGAPLGVYCDARKLPLDARLKLFLQVLLAVQHAHGQLVVHRDLKPSNVLVTGDGQVRLLDFGIAKLLTDGQAQETELTQLGGRALTPQYAAPEQILGKTISTAVDIYALGVMLYELLTGVLPFRPKRDSRGALEDAILDTEPDAPSRAPPATTATSIARRLLRGDLDTIILKALKKAPQARYATVAAFADDLQRYMRGEPVLAQPDSTLYRAGKFLKRNRWGVAGATVVLAALSAGMGVSLWQARIAQKEARTASEVKGFMQGIFLANSAQQTDPLRARQTTARELLDIGANKLHAAMDLAPEAKLAMLKMFSELYSQLELPERALAFAQEHVALIRKVHGNQSLELIDGLLILSVTLRGYSPDHPHIEAVLDEAASLLELHRADASAEQRGDHAVLAAEYFADRDFNKARAYAHRAADLLRNAPGSDDVSMVLSKAARIDLRAGACDAALATATEGVRAAHGLTAQAQAGNGGNTALGTLLEVQGLASWCLGDATAAEKHLREAHQSSDKIFGAQDMETVRIQARLADVLLARGQTTEATQRLDQAERVLRDYDAKDSSRLHTEALAAVGHAQMHAGQPAAALNKLEQVLTLRASISASPSVAEVLRDKARALLALKRPAEAARALESALAMREKSGLKNPTVEQEEALLRTQIAPGLPQGTP